MIGEIVNNELPVEVRTLNINTGLIENKKVVGWSKQKASKEDWMYLSYKRKHHGGRKTGLKLTKNHTVYTKNFEEVRAETLKVGDVIYLYSKFTLNYIQEQFILGTLLGDGYLSDNHILQINHSIKQKDLVDLKKNILYNVISKEIKKISGHGSEMCGFLTKSFHNLSTINFFDLCYSNNGKKLVTKSWLNKLTPISLAFWYMDDGSLSNMEGKKSQSILHTNSFSDNEINLICEYFNNLGLDCYKCSDGKNGQIVKFTPTGTERFNCLISPYIHKSMKYKLLTEYKNVNYILDSLLKTTKTFHKNYIETTVQTIDHNPCFANDLCYKFDIEVEDNHNFFANNILVHNCSVQGANFHYGLKAGEYGVAVFDILENGQWINNNDIFFNKRFEELKTVQLLYKGPFNMQKVAELAEAKETFNYCGHVREGVVIKLVNEREDQRIGRIAIKYVSDNYLMKS
jgi:recombination protein RecA